MDLNIQQKTYCKLEIQKRSQQKRTTWRYAFSESGDSGKDHSSEYGSVDIRRDLSAEDNLQKEIIPTVYVYPPSINV